MQSVDNITLAAMNEFNNLRRDVISAEIGQFKHDYDKMHFLCSILMGYYKFDYSVLFDENRELDRREQTEVEFKWEGKKYKAKSVPCLYADEKHGVRVSPSIHALRMGTCAYFSQELLWYAKEFGIKCEVINEKTICYDQFYDKTGNPNDGLRPMMHYYVKMNLDGKEYKIDIAGALMARDYCLSAGDEKLISSKDFILTDPDNPNPFDKFYKNDKGEPGGE